MTSSQDEETLKALLKRLVGAGPPELAPIEVQLLASSLTPTSNRTARSIAFLCLSKYCEAIQRTHKSDEEKTGSITYPFQPFLQATFSNNGELQPESLLPVTGLLAVLLSLAPSASIRLLTSPLDSASESPTDPLAVLLEAAELPSLLQSSLAELLANAAGTKLGREMVRNRAMEWLRGGMDLGGDKETGVLCAVALSKLGREEGLPSQRAGETDGQEGSEELVLCEKMMSLITSSSGSSSALLPTLEGLSVLSLRARIKNYLASSGPFLKSLLALAPTMQAKGGSLPVTPRGSMDIDEKLFEPVETGICYGVTTILVNLTSKKPIVSAGDQQIAKLRAMAISGKKGSAENVEDPLEGDEAVRSRVKCVLRAGCVSALRGLARAESILVKEGLGKLCLNLVEDKADRPAFIRDGGFKVLSGIIRDLSSASATNGYSPLDDAVILPAAQALAKLVITTSPRLLFPPPHLTTSLNALTPVYTLLIHPSSTMLQQFEALMALTNLASIDPSVASRVVEASLITPPRNDSMWRGSGMEDKVKVIAKVEELMLDDNTMIRRAASQLVCNLTNSPAGFEHYTGEGFGGTIGRARSQLSILLVLTNVDDLQTRLAAGGALAILTESASVCEALLTAGDEVTSSKQSVWGRVLGMLDPEDAVDGDDKDGQPIPIISNTPPNPDSVYRAVIILLNLITYTSTLEESRRLSEFDVAQATGLEDKLLSVLRLKVADEVLQPTVECLKILKRYPGISKA